MEKQKGVSLAPKKEPDKDIFTKITGSFGRYQRRLFILVCLSKAPVAFHQMAIIFMAPKGNYNCPGQEKNNTCPCSNPIYDTSVFSNTMIMEWNLICDKKWLAHFSQMLFQFGILLGSIFFGMASDRFGRKNPLLVSVVIEIGTGILCSYLPSYWLFTFCRIILAIAVGGTMVITFVIIMEFVGTDYRDVISALYQAAFNIGHVLLPVFSYFLRDFRNFNLGISLTTVAMLLYFCYIPDTPRWLVAVKRTDEAVVILEKVAKMNKLPTETIRADIEAFQEAADKNKLTKGTILDLFRTPNMRKNILIMSFDWFTCSYCFYGVSQYVGQLGGNIFINVEISASVTFLGTLTAIPLLRMLGRRTIVIIFNALCGVCLILLALTPDAYRRFKIVFASIGDVSAFIVFVLVYLYCTELFPTVVRNAAIGFSSMMARVGSMIAPFVVGTGDKAKWLPPIIFSIPPLIAAFLTFSLPETKGHALMTTIEEGENFGKKKNEPSVKIAT